MPTREREESRDRDLVLKHQHSFSESISSRSSSTVPMWDSSDPERAPPPLPLNPGAGSPITKSGTSANVTAAAEAIAARVRESQYTTNTSPTKSPEKSLIKGHHHKRLQSINNGTVKDLSSYLENGRTTDRSPERSPDRSRNSSSVDRSDITPTRPESRSGTPTPMSRDLGRDIPPLRPSSRPPLKAILGEESPQSATMKALHGRLGDDKDTAPVDSRRDSMALVRTPQTIDAISSQIFSLTTIATNLQQEMAQLSRRSRDNATDLVSLKEATNSRDEDIRKTLRELVVNLNTKSEEVENAKKAMPRSNGTFFMDEKAHLSPSTPKNISLPRIPSPASFAASLDRDMISSPTPYSTDGAAAIALLEKILREMGTREGQEHISNAIAEYAAKGVTGPSSPDITKRLEEIVRMLKDNSDSKAMVRATETRNTPTTRVPESSYDYSLHPAVALARAGRNMSMGNIPINAENKEPKSPAPGVLVNEDMTKLIKRIKDSVTESGGLTNEVKALVRELRGEVLGMGREIGRKLDAVEKNGGKTTNTGSDRDHVVEIVEEGLTQLKKHMDEVLREHRRQSSASVVSKNAVDNQEIYATVQSALRELQLDQPKASGAEREAILDAVREAWEMYKPEFELQNFGLERDEILECLESGLKEHRSQLTAGSNGASYEEVVDAVKQGLQDFKTPRFDNESSLTRDEIIMTMRECMESLDASSRQVNQDHQREEIMDAVKEALLLHAAALSRDSTVSREDLLDAVKDGFINHEPIAKDMEINRDDLFDAIKAGLSELPTHPVNDQVLVKMQDLIDGMRDEFQQYSAASGRDTEQVLDAMKDGMESLRSSIETYVDRASDVTGKDEIIETVKDSMDNLRADLEASIAASRGPTSSSSTELLDMMEKEFEHLKTSLTSSLARSGGSTGGREELLDALREGFEELKDTNVPLKNSSAIEDELRHLRETLAVIMTKSGGIDQEEVLDTIRQGIDRMQLDSKSGRSESILSGTSELLDAFHDGLDKLKTDIEQVISKESIQAIRNDIERVVNDVNRPIDMTVNYEILDLLKEGLAAVQLDVAKLVRQQETVSDRGREVVVADGEATKSASRPELENLEVMITQLKIKVDALDGQAASVDHMALRPDIEHLENMVKDLQDSVHNIKDGVRSDTATKDDIEAIETILLNSKAKLDELSMPDADDLAKAVQMESIETLLKELSHSVDDLTLRQEDNLPSKAEFSNLETTMKDIQSNFGELRTRLGVEGVQRSDVESLETMCLEIQDQLKNLVPKDEKVASSNAIADLQTMVKDLHDRSQGFHDKMLLEAEMTAQAFDARKIEHGGLADKIEDVKAFLENVRLELKSKIESGGQGIESLALTLTTLGEALTAANAVESLKEMKELLETKLADIEDSQTAGLESHQTAFLEKQNEHKSAIIDELTVKLDLHFSDLMAKYDAAQTATTEKVTSVEEKTREGIDAMLTTKRIADDLKILVDTLGNTVTESCNTMAEDSKTVFLKVEELGVKQDVGFSSLASELKDDNQLTRTDLARASSTIDNVYSLVADHNPKVMEAIHDVLNVMSQHFEMAQKSTEEIKSSVKEIPSSIPLPALPAPLPSPTEERSFTPEKYDDSGVHDKLDKLVSIAANSGSSTPQIELLEQIKAQVTATASDFDAFVKSQLALTANKEEFKHKEAEEAGIAVEKRVAQKQAVEVEIVKLTEEKELLSRSVNELKQSVDSLQQEEKQMLNIKAKLQAELSSLETALQIRKEEMHIMEGRAEKLERRILDGVLDQSRSVLLASRPPSSLNVMNLKRIPSATSQNTATTGATVGRSTRTTTSTKSNAGSSASVLGDAVGKALKRRQAAPASTAGSVRSDRRILSLSTISGNKGTARESLGLVDSPKSGKGNINAGFGALKRSHSVKSTLPTRNTSWSSSKHQTQANQLSHLDKENSVLEEEEESSDTGTERRSSFTSTFDGTESFADGTSSRRLSYAQSSVAGTMHSSDRDLGEEDEVNPGSQLQIYTGIQEYDFAAGNKDMVLFGKDSGLGSEPPTATLETDGNFFGGK